MFLISWIISGISILNDYFRGFTQSDILTHRLDIIQTTILTSLIINGLKPVYKIIINTILLVRDIVVGLFSPQKKLQNLNHAVIKNEAQEQKLLAQLEKIKDLQEKLAEKKENQTEKVKKWEDYKLRKKILKQQKKEDKLAKQEAIMEQVRKARKRKEDEEDE